MQQQIQRGRRTGKGVHVAKPVAMPGSSVHDL